MPVLIPDCVESVAIDAARAQQLRVLRLVFADQKQPPAAGRRPRRGTHFRDDVFGRGIEDAVCCVEAQTVEMKLADPVGSVLDHERAHRTGVGRVVADRVAPLPRLAEERRREIAKKITDRSEVVVNDVEDHREAVLVRGVDSVEHRPVCRRGATARRS